VRIYSAALTQEQVRELVGTVLPAVTGVSPVSGPAGGGTAVTITGSGFTGATGVSFGSAAAESFTVNGDTSITAVSPAGSGTVDVTVSKPSGTSSPAVQFTYLSAFGGKYTVTPLADPAYTVGTTSEGFVTMTVKSGVTGLKAFTVNVGVTASHTGEETAVFVQFRNGVQIALGSVDADFDQQAEAVVSFNVQPGDVVKVYIVDTLTNAEDANPTLLQ
jgi:hypothetical protein